MIHFGQISANMSSPAVHVSKAMRTIVAYKPLPFADQVSNYRSLPGFPLDCMTSVPSLNTYFTRVNLNGLPVTSSS